MLPLDLWQDSTTQQGQAVQQNQQPHAQATEERMRVMYHSPLPGPVPMSLLKLLRIPLETVWEASAQTLCRAVKTQTLALPAPILLTWSHALLEQRLYGILLPAAFYGYCPRKQGRALCNLSAHRETQRCVCELFYLGGDTTVGPSDDAELSVLRVQREKCAS